MSTAEAIQVGFAILTAPVTVWFIWLYAADHWEKHWFGWSLMMIAIAVLMDNVTTILFRLLGPDYWGRDVLIVAVAVLTFAAMLARTLVLRAAKRRDRTLAPPPR